MTSEECTICNKFMRKRPVATRSETLRQRVSRHHINTFSWPALLDSAAACYCCKILLTGCRACFLQHGINEAEIMHGKLRFYYPTSIDYADTEEIGKELIFFMRDGSRFDVEMFIDAEDENPLPQAWDRMPASRRTSPRTDSIEALATIKGWIAECTTEHDFCESPEEEPQLPTRVLDVGLEDGVVKLAETKGARAKYICLSHCWGLDQIITTTKCTLQPHKREVPWDALSTTFRDAIHLTRTLGYRYIWIDSLCIVQDDEDDWAVESARMATVYSNGALTIAATKSPNGQGGIFSQTQDTLVSGQTPAGEGYRVFFRELIDHHLESQEEIEGDDTLASNPTSRYFPLLTRAWVYQERMLSTRVVHFGKYEVCFECKSGFQCECDGFGIDNSRNRPPIPLMKVEHSYALDNSYSNAGFEAERAYGMARLWRSMVCTYTELHLTRSTDRLPAIGGLAKQMALERRSPYLSGLWRDTLNDDLVWWVHNIARKAARTYSPTSPPTWSWARVDTPVSYWDTILYTEQDQEFQERQPYEHLAEIEDCHVSWSTPAVDEFGLISSGRLNITGLVAKGSLESDASRKTEGGKISEYSVSFAAGEPSLAIQTDYILENEGPGETRPGTEVLCLRMSRIQEGRTDNLISLVLRPSPNSHDCFERIGMLVIKARPPPVNRLAGPFRNAELCTVTII